MQFRNKLSSFLCISHSCQSWIREGKRHRINGPAYIEPYGFRVWYKNGKYHRLDGPAIIHNNGFEEWYRNGEYHRPPI